MSEIYSDNKTRDELVEILVEVGMVFKRHNLNYGDSLKVIKALPNLLEEIKEKFKKKHVLEL